MKDAFIDPLKANLRGVTVVNLVVDVEDNIDNQDLSGGNLTTIHVTHSVMTNKARGMVHR